jgi:hypothetical protein
MGVADDHLVWAALMAAVGEAGGDAARCLCRTRVHRRDPRRGAPRRLGPVLACLAAVIAGTDVAGTVVKEVSS